MRRANGLHALLIACTVLLLAATTQPAEYLGKPCAGTPIAVPGVIKATEYDIAPDGKNGITFNYNGGAKKTDLRTSKDGIGLARFGKGHETTKGEPEDPQQTYLGWTHGGEWVKYTLHVAEAGTYAIGAHVAAGGKGGTLSFSFGPSVTTGPINIPTTAGFRPGVEVYHVWERLENLAEVKLDAGDVVMTVKIEKPAGFNIESITLTKR